MIERLIKDELTQLIRCKFLNGIVTTVNMTQISGCQSSWTLTTSMISLRAPQICGLVDDHGKVKTTLLGVTNDF